MKSLRDLGLLLAAGSLLAPAAVALAVQVHYAFADHHGVHDDHGRHEDHRRLADHPRPESGQAVHLHGAPALGHGTLPESDCRADHRHHEHAVANPGSGVLHSRLSGPRPPERDVGPGPEIRIAAYAPPARALLDTTGAGPCADPGSLLRLHCSLLI